MPCIQVHSFQAGTFRKVDIDRYNRLISWRSVRDRGVNNCVCVQIIRFRREVLAGGKMKQPTEEDFDVRVTDVGVDVFFKPTMNHFPYVFLIDPKDIARWGRLSDTRHTSTDTGDYLWTDVEALAFRLAS